MKPIDLIIAEGHRLFRQLLVTTFKQHNINTIAEAQSDTELLELLKTRQPQVALLDIEMPGGVFKTLELLNNSHPRLKVIINTQHDNSHLEYHLIEKGVCACLNKNTDADIMISTIRDVAGDTYKSKKIPLKKNEHFSLSETRLIPLMCEGKSNKAIATELQICSKTVEAHKKSLFKKTHTYSAVECVGYFFKTGLNHLW